MIQNDLLLQIVRHLVPNPIRLVNALVYRLVSRLELCERFIFCLQVR